MQQRFRSVRRGSKSVVDSDPIAARPAVTAARAVLRPFYAVASTSSVIVGPSALLCNEARRLVNLVVG